MTEQYEITFILDEGAKADKIENILKEEGSILKPTLDLGVKQFVYPIKKKTAGNYFAIEFTAEKEKLQAIETELKAEKTLIRFLIVKELRKPIDLPPRIKPEKAEDKEKETIKSDAAEELEQVEVVEAPAAEKTTEEIIEEPAVEEKTEGVEQVAEPIVEKLKEETKEAVAEEKPEEKPAKKPRAKAEKVSADELDKKLEELVKE